ncbi:hypothetical protein BRC2024_HCTLARHO_CDS_0014 [Acinetobacter phage vB_AbaS_Silvergun]
MMDKQAWQNAAFFTAKRIIANKYRSRAFLAEELLADVVQAIDDVFDRRAWGGVIRTLSSDGYIRRNGYAAAKSSNGSGKPVWIKVPGWSKL